MACCQFGGHRVKVFLLKPESMNATKEVPPRVQVQNHCEKTLRLNLASFRGGTPSLSRALSTELQAHLRYTVSDRTFAFCGSAGSSVASDGRAGLDGCNCRRRQSAGAWPVRLRKKREK